MDRRKTLTRQQWAFDVLVAVIVATFGFVGTFEIGDGATEYTRDADLLHFLLIGGMSAPLAFRRVYTVPVLAIVLGSWVLDRGLDYPDTPAAFGVGIIFYTVGAVLDRRQSALFGGISAAIVVGWTAAGVVTLESVTTPALFTTMIATVTPLLVGREIHDRRQRVEQLRLRAERAEQEREEQAKQAVVEERARIARELHDVVAHQMTVMTLQAEGAKRIASNEDPRLKEALETISDAGHAALAEMRRTVGLLRDEDHDLETQPLPRLTDVSKLIDQMRGAGVEVDLSIEGEKRPLSDSTELAAYRIVQESLTNAVRHGGPDVSAKVSIEFAPDRLDVMVIDDGRGSSAGNLDNGGHGLIGMRERVTVLGGEFDAGPKTGGGYQVRATIPVQP